MRIRCRIAQDAKRWILPSHWLGGRKVKRMCKPLISVILVLVPPLVFGFLGKPTEMGIAMVAGSIAAFFINIDQFQRFKVGSFQAEMKRAVEEAYASIEEVRKLGRVLIEVALRTLTMANRYDGMDAHQKHALRDDLKRMADELRLENDQSLREVDEQFCRYFAWDLFGCFAGQVRQDVGIPTEVCERLSQMRDYSSTDFPGRDRIEAVLGEHFTRLSSETLELLEAYLYYRDNRQLRRPEALSCE